MRVKVRKRREEKREKVSEKKEEKKAAVRRNREREAKKRELRLQTNKPKGRTLAMYLSQTIDLTLHYTLSPSITVITHILEYPRRHHHHRHHQHHRYLNQYQHHSSLKQAFFVYVASITGNQPFTFIYLSIKLFFLFFVVPLRTISLIAWAFITFAIPFHILSPKRIKSLYFPSHAPPLSV